MFGLPDVLTTEVERVTFRSNPTVWEEMELPDEGVLDMLKREQHDMLFSADRYFAHEHGGELTAKFMEHLPSHWDGDRLVVDTRAHMLKEGWYPCIPGYHIDDIPRNENGQPQVFDPEYKSEHALAVVGEVSRTVFAIGEVSLPVPDTATLDKPLYGIWDDIIRAEIEAGSLREWTAPAESIVLFGWGDLHRGQAAVADGWRLFMRASRGTGREIHNDVRFQTQVYLENPNEGW